MFCKRLVPGAFNVGRIGSIRTPSPMEVTSVAAKKSQNEKP
jgi:hypothetical protein